MQIVFFHFQYSQQVIMCNNTFRNSLVFRNNCVDETYKLLTERMPISDITNQGGRINYTKLRETNKAKVSNAISSRIILTHMIL